MNAPDSGADLLTHAARGALPLPRRLLPVGVAGQPR